MTPWLVGLWDCGYEVDRMALKRSQIEVWELSQWEGKVIPEVKIKHKEDKILSSQYNSTDKDMIVNKILVVSCLLLEFIIFLMDFFTFILTSFTLYSFII